MFRKLSAGAACAVLGMLAGCAAGVPEYKEPPVATVAVKDSQARIVFRSAGMPMAVNFAIDTSISGAEDFESIGRVFHSGREKLLPWIAALTEKSRKAISDERPEIERTVEAERRIRIKGISGWSDVTPQMTTTGSCGPLFSQFVPGRGKTYLVEFRFNGTSSCSQKVYEIGTDEKRLPVAPEQPQS